MGLARLGLAGSKRVYLLWWAPGPVSWDCGALSWLDACGTNIEEEASMLLREEVCSGGEEVVLRCRGYLGDICPVPIWFGFLA